jgi:hypothetical protein
MQGTVKWFNSQKGFGFIQPKNRKILGAEFSCGLTAISRLSPAPEQQARDLVRQTPQALFFHKKQMQSLARSPVD